MTASVLPLNALESSANQAANSMPMSRVAQAIKQASQKTGVDFSYLMNKASQESSMDPNAKASGSSATGLFQFTNQTWLQMVKNHGSEYGLSQYADHISVDSQGAAHVSDPKWRSTILSLRKDPTVSAEMSGALDKDNMASLKADVGGSIGPTELYLAHFLGAGGASDFIDTLRSNPNAKAAQVLPQAAAANPSVFYDKSGNPRTVNQIYQHFAQKFETSPSLKDQTLVASNDDSLALPASTGASPASLASHASYAPPVMSSLAASSSAGNAHASANSLLTTMVLAQMDSQSRGLSGLSSANARGQKHGDNMSPVIPIA